MGCIPYIYIYKHIYIHSIGGNVINRISGFKQNVGITVTIPSALSPLLPFLPQTTEAVSDAAMALLSMSVL